MVPFSVAIVTAGNEESCPWQYRNSVMSKTSPPKLRRSFLNRLIVLPSAETREIIHTLKPRINKAEGSFNTREQKQFMARFFQPFCWTAFVKGGERGGARCIPKFFDSTGSV